jgi:hypothetical protein
LLVEIETRCLQVVSGAKGSKRPLSPSQEVFRARRREGGREGGRGGGGEEGMCLEEGKKRRGRRQSVLESCCTRGMM